MKKFIFKIIFTITPILLLLVIIEVLYRDIPNVYKYKKKYLDNHSNEIETLILGNSHNYYGINPIYFSKYNTFNASYIVQRTFFDFEILKKYENNFKKLKTVILPIIPMELFFKKIENTGISFNPSIHKYRIYYDLKLPIKYGNYFEVTSKMFRLKIGLSDIYNYLVKNKDLMTTTELGWGYNFYSKDAKDLERTGEHMAKQHTDISYPMNELSTGIKYNIDILESILKWCQKRNIQLFLYTPPIYESYRKKINPNREELAFRSLKEITSKYKICTYTNLYDNLDFNENDYYDADHLSEIGAEKLSKIINKKIIKLYEH